MAAELRLRKLSSDRGRRGFRSGGGEGERDKNYFTGRRKEGGGSKRGKRKRGVGGRGVARKRGVGCGARVISGRESGEGRERRRHRPKNKSYNY